MQKSEIIRKTEEFLNNKFAGGAFLAAHPEEKAYRLEHSYRVANIGREIAAREGFDVTETVVACLLHDVSYCEDFGEDGWRDHGRRSAAIARPFLESLGLPEDRVDDICYGIAIHVDDKADFDGVRTPFALTVGDADNIDRFDVYRVHETLSHDRFSEKNLSEKTEYVEKRLKRLKELLNMPLATGTAEKMWRDRLSFYIEFLGRLKSQLDNSDGVKGKTSP